MLRFAVCCGILLIIAVSCSRRLSEKEVNEYRAELAARYCTNDIHAAEEALYSDLRTLSEWESNNVRGDHFTIDFKGAQALDHEGLFMIYRKMGETNKMKEEFKLIVRLRNESDRAQGSSPPPPFSEDELARSLEKRDRQMNVQWETNHVDNAGGAGISSHWWCRYQFSLLTQIHFGNPELTIIKKAQTRAIPKIPFPTLSLSVLSAPSCPSCHPV